MKSWRRKVKNDKKKETESVEKQNRDGVREGKYQRDGVEKVNINVFCIPLFSKYKRRFLELHKKVKEYQSE